MTLSVSVTMKSSNFENGRRNRNYGEKTNSDRVSYSSSSYNSDASSDKKRNPLAAAARSVAGFFIACFTPPNAIASVNLCSSEEPKSPSVASDPSGGSVKDRRQSSNRGTIYGSPNRSVHTMESGSVKFTMEEITAATRNFSNACKIGQGGFGTVYKGRLEDGAVVAMKRAKTVRSTNDKLSGREFRSEIRTLAQVEHLNLVRFYGYLEHEDERIVVMEYVPNGTLREHLDCLYGGKVLNLAKRLDIATDIAHAITYLHMYTDHPIIHRDIKSSNILLAGNFRAKVTDFGFSRLAADTNSGHTHVSTQVKGTAGYLDPEYLKTHQLTDKSDVYSFGVLLVELVTGRRPIETKREIMERITTKWAMKKYADGDAASLLDPMLEQTPANISALEKILELALPCMAPCRRNRPTMKKCGEILWIIRKNYKEQSALDLRSLSSNSWRSMSMKEA